MEGSYMKMVKVAFLPHMPGLIMSAFDNTEETEFNLELRLMRVLVQYRHQSLKQISTPDDHARQLKVLLVPIELLLKSSAMLSISQSPITNAV